MTAPHESAVRIRHSQVLFMSVCEEAFSQLMDAAVASTG